MTYLGNIKRDYEQPNGIRRIELRYSGEIDASGKLKLRRCVGKSFLDKSRKAGVCLPAGTGPERGADQIPVCPSITARPDKSA